MLYRKYEVWVPEDAPNELTAYFIEIAINEAIDTVLGGETLVDVWPVPDGA